ncbi:SMI1/KNR4 family protein [Dyella tabacisoli]|uniref:SMI1/KNR4 family protein n=1 Tax=Dyella tabacisoli TaxID=2282381 RepID=A0A369UUX8_9GAMM|nr:SMI1/KNR4 family protein [Dyella tabacisoli]RDD83538.1 SMI1/KNR4 family protein [Dyella tabacisoli]
MLRMMYPYGEFGAAATGEDIAAVETALGVRLPEQLRALYLECDGFREDRGNAKYLLSLTDEDHIGSLKSLTMFCWTEFKGTWPDLDLSPYVFFGSSSADELWGIRCDGTDEVIAFHHNMEPKCESALHSPVSADFWPRRGQGKAQ